MLYLTDPRELGSLIGDEPGPLDTRGLVRVGVGNEEDLQLVGEPEITVAAVVGR